MFANGYASGFANASGAGNGNGQQMFWPGMAAAAAQYGASGAAMPTGGCYYGAGAFEAAFFQTLQAQMQMQQFMQQHAAANGQPPPPGGCPDAGGLPPWMAAAAAGHPLWRNPSMGSCTSLSASTSVLQPLPNQRAGGAATPHAHQPFQMRQPHLHHPAQHPQHPQLPPSFKPEAQDEAPGPAASGFPGALPLLQERLGAPVSDDDDDDERLELPPNEFGAMLGGADGFGGCEGGDMMAVDGFGGEGFC